MKRDHTPAAPHKAEFLPSQRIASGEIDAAYDKIYYENKALRQRIQDLHECALATIGGYEKLLKSKIAKILDASTPDDLRTLRAVINGKLSKRQITPEQQTAMQAARKKKTADK